MLGKYIYLSRKFVLDQTVTLTTKNTPSEVILHYMDHKEFFCAWKPWIYSIYRKQWRQWSFVSVGGNVITNAVSSLIKTPDAYLGLRQ